MFVRSPIMLQHLQPGCLGAFDLEGSAFVREGDASLTGRQLIPGGDGIIVAAHDQGKASARSSAHVETALAKLVVSVRCLPERHWDSFIHFATLIRNDGGTGE